MEPSEYRRKRCPHGWPEIHYCNQCTRWKLETEYDELNKKYVALLKAHSELLATHETVLLRLEMSEGKIIDFTG